MGLPNDPLVIINVPELPTRPPSSQPFLLIRINLTETPSRAHDLVFGAVANQLDRQPLVVNNDL